MEQHRRKGPRTLPFALSLVALAAAAGIAWFGYRELTRPPAGSSEPAFRYDLQAFSQAPEGLPRRALLATLDLGLAEPRGVAASPDGRILVCGDRELLALDPSGVVSARYPLEGEPGCLTAGADGRIYLGMGDHLEVLDPDTGEVALWPYLGSQAIITSVAVSGGGVYVADAGNRVVLRFESHQAGAPDPGAGGAGGRLAGTLTGSAEEGFFVPSPHFDLAAGAEGSLWVANPGRHRLEHYSADGTYLGAWGQRSAEAIGFGGCCNPTDFALLPDGSFVTSEKGILRVKIHGADGRLAGVVALPRDFRVYREGLDLAVLPDGRVLLLVPGERTVRIYAAAGEEAAP